MLQRALLGLMAMLIQVQVAGAAMEVEQVRGLLQKMQTDEEWGEAVLADGRVRSLLVAAVSQDSVAVVEVVGALQQRAAVYALSAFRSLRVLGEHRIQQHRPAFRPQKSGRIALLFEAVVPGTGYFYAGHKKQGLALLGLATTVVGTAIATGESGAAGWVPISLWIKISSLTNLRDLVRADDRLDINGSVQLGTMQGQQGSVPALRLNMDF